MLKESHNARTNVPSLSLRSCFVKMGWLVVLVLVRRDALEVAWRFGEEAAVARVDWVRGLVLEEARRSEGGAAEAETGGEFRVECVGVDGVSRRASVRE